MGDLRVAGGVNTYPCVTIVKDFGFYCEQRGKWL